MVRVIANVMVVPVLIVCRKVSLLIPDAVLESVAEKVILPVSPPGQVYCRSAALFGRGRTLAASTHRVAAFRVRCHDLLDSNVVLLVITEVIFVQKPLAQTETKIRHPHLLWVIVKAHATVVGNAVLFPVDEKAMEMAVRPPQGQLEDRVKLSDGGLSADKETTPDERTDAT